MTKVGLYAIGTSTTLESNKSHRPIAILRSRAKSHCACVSGLAQFLVVSLSPAGHAAGPAWSRPRDIHGTVLASLLGFPRSGLGCGPCPEAHLARAPSRSSYFDAGRCFSAVDARAEESPTRLAMDERPNHQSVHALSLRTTARPAYQPLEPRAPVKMRACDVLRVCLPNRMWLRRPMALVGTPAVGARARDANGLQQRFVFPTDQVLPSCKPRGSPWAWGRRHGVPSPAWMGVAAHGVLPLVALGTASPTSL